MFYIFSYFAGAWNFSVSPKGYINQDLYVEVLKDLDQHLTKNNIQRPVLLFIDGAKPHISLKACTVLPGQSDTACSSEA